MIDEIRRRQAEGINAGAAVEKVELMRRRGRLSLHQPHQFLNRRKRSAQQLPYFKPMIASGALREPGWRVAVEFCFETKSAPAHKAFHPA